MLPYRAPEIDYIKLQSPDILVDSSYWLGGDGNTKPPGDSTNPGFPDDPDPINPSSILDVILGG